MLHKRFVQLCFLSSALAFGQTQVDLRTQSKSIDFSGANATKPFKSGNLLPSTCGAGEMFFKSDAPAGANLYGCTALNSWTLESAGTVALGGDLSGSPSAAVVTQVQGRAVSSAIPSSGQFLVWNSSTLRWEPQTVSVGGGSGSTLGGDLSGQIGAAIVTQMQGRPIATTAPSNGQTLTWNGATNRWEPQTGSSGGGSAGAGMASQLGDFAVSRASSTSLSIGPNCAFSTPCNARFGTVTYSFTSGASLALTSGTGAVYIYIDKQGTMTAGHNLSLSCSSGCIAVSGITSFPLDSIPLFVWTATNNSWDTLGVDERSSMATKNILAGVGITTTELQGQTSVAVDPSVVAVRISPPASSGSSCVPGNWAADTSFYYLCVGANVWMRAGISSW